MHAPRIASPIAIVTTNRRRWCLSALCAAAMLSACDGSDTRVNEPVISVATPEDLRDARAVDRSALYVDVTINGETTSYAVDDTLDIRTSVARGAIYELDLIWYERISEGAAVNYNLPLAGARREFPVNDHQTISIGATEYTTEGAAFDYDNDGFWNLVERRAGSDPNDSGSVPTDPDVSIPRIDPTNAPSIDGNYDPIWENARFSDVDGNSLLIDNLMQDAGVNPTRSDGNSGFRWFALHDGESLYIFVIGESGSTSTTYRDSVDPWQDDSVDIYIDGDNSKNQSYDGINDYQIIVPLLESSVNTVSNNSYFVKGYNALRPGSFAFHTCDCGDEKHTWEFKLPLTSFDIEVGRPFGFDIHMNIDNDGGERDEKWGWWHPSIAGSGLDYFDMTWKNPSYMATAILEP